MRFERVVDEYVALVVLEDEAKVVEMPEMGVSEFGFLKPVMLT